MGKYDWIPQAGSQQLFLNANVFEILYEGTRGPGKTDCLLMAFAMHTGKGYREDWRGIIFRETFAQLTDLVAKSKKWFPRLFPGCKFNASAYTWTWPTGEQLRFAYMRKHDDYDNYHGHAYPFIGWEELTNWADDVVYCKMFSCCRSSNPNVPRMVRATCNPSGKGHNWVKRRFDLPAQRMVVRFDCRDEEGNLEPPRLAIHGSLSENKILLDADPTYPQKVSASASSPAERKAWMEGDWNVVAGGMFDDVWYDAKKYIILQPFDIPESWRIDRSFDWGSTKPFSVGWWAESDGSDVLLADGRWKSTVPGDLFRIAEWYGCTEKPNTGLKMESAKIAEGIVEREIKMGLYGRVVAGVADSSIFTEEDGHCIATNMEEEVRIDGRRYDGIDWLHADKRPGSRVNGWMEMRTRMLNTMPPEDEGVREKPGLFFFINCTDSIRTLPVLPRDKIKTDDVDTETEDHIADEVRYRVRWDRKETTIRRARGMG